MISFFLGVFIGNIFDFKYVLIVYFLYMIIKNDPVYGVRPRNILSSVMMRILTKPNETMHNNMDEIEKYEPGIDSTIFRDKNVTIEEISENKFTPSQKLLRFLSQSHEKK